MTSPTDRAWEIIEKVGVCMLTTRASNGEFRSRPVEARPSRSRLACNRLERKFHFAIHTLAVEGCALPCL